jgi:hypothetical protein
MPRARKNTGKKSGSGTTPTGVTAAKLNVVAVNGGGNRAE